MVLNLNVLRVPMPQDTKRHRRLTTVTRMPMGIRTHTGTIIRIRLVLDSTVEALAMAADLEALATGADLAALEAAEADDARQEAMHIRTAVEDVTRD